MTARSAKVSRTNIGAILRGVGVLGGGISGLFSAHFLGEGSEVMEAEATVGGLARCFGGEGFRSDVGGHLLFSKDKEALAHEVHALDGNVRVGRRANKILYRGLHLKYPFENGIDALAKEEIVDIVTTFAENPHRAPPTNFREWMFHVFGDGLTNRYLLPYNEKIWKTPAEQMSLEWVDRVPRPSLREIVRTAVGIPTEGYTHQLHFRYPAVGGFEALPLSVARKLGDRVTTSFRVQTIQGGEGGWTVISDRGEERRYRELVATIPLTNLFDALADVPEDVRAAAHELRFNSLRVILLGLKRTDVADYTALYVPDPSSLYHRVCFNHAFSPDMVPDGCRSVSCEVTVPPGSELDAWSDEALLARTTDDLVRDGIIRREDVCFRAVHRERFAYVVYTLGYAQRVQKVRDYVEARGIHLAGRFAEYKYVNTDACVRRALDLARRLRGGDIAPEARLPDPLPFSLA